MGIIGWIKRNKLASVLLLIIAYYFLRNYFGFNSFGPRISSSYNYAQEDFGMSAPANIKMALPQSIGRSNYSDSPPPPTTDVTNRMVVQNSYLSLVVKNVSQSMQKIKDHTRSIGGYMVSSYISNPQENSNGNITLRIPAVKLEETLSILRNLAIKVASERLTGTDVTDAYVDNESRLSVLNANMARFKEIMGEVKEVSDILKIQQQVFSLQDQIDRIKGQNKYMEQTSKMALLTVYLSTDEFTLPYSPSEPWRPDVIFKTAVRSLIVNMRGLANSMIWIVVYSVVWVPILLIIVYLKNRKNKTKENS